jgi:phage-related protein
MGFMMDLVGNLVKELETIIPAGSGDVIIERDKLKSKVNELTALVSNYKHENEGLTKKLYSVGNKLSSTEAKLEKFMKYSDEVLQLKVSEWIKDHNGEFDLKVFCDRYEVGEQRVTNIVQDMISGGFIKPM